MNTYLAGVHNNAMLAAIRAAGHPAAPRTGDSVRPDDRALPYAVMYPLGSSVFDGSHAAQDLDSDAWPVTQVTFVGESREQVDDLRDAVRAAVLGTYLTVAGRRVGPVRLHDERGVDKDDDTTPPLLFAVDRYRAYSTPAA